MSGYPTGDPSEHADWCRNMFRMLAQGGVWGVPRSGLVFTKRGEELVLTSRMPWDPELPMSADELRRYQDDDFETIRVHFAAGGVTVTEGSKA